MSLPRVEDGLLLLEYIRVSIVSLPVGDALILLERMKNEHCLSLPRVENGLYYQST
jgi:hypothetical protein